MVLNQRCLHNHHCEGKHKPNSQIEHVVLNSSATIQNVCQLSRRSTHQYPESCLLDPVETVASPGWAMPWASPVRAPATVLDNLAGTTVNEETRRHNPSHLPDSLGRDYAIEQTCCSYLGTLNSQNMDRVSPDVSHSCVFMHPFGDSLVIFSSRIPCLLLIYLLMCQTGGQVNIKVWTNYWALLYAHVNVDSYILIMNHCTHQ